MSQATREEFITLNLDDMYNFLTWANDYYRVKKRNADKAEATQLYNNARIGDKCYVNMRGMGWTLGYVESKLPNNKLRVRVGNHSCTFAPKSAYYRKAPDTAKVYNKIEQDAYATLGLKPGATQAQIKEAYRTLCLKYHPDRNGNGASTHNQMSLINLAYNTLKTETQ